MLAAPFHVETKAQPITLGEGSLGSQKALEAAEDTLLHVL